MPMTISLGMMIVSMGCEDENFDNIPVDFEFRLINEQGNTSVNFSEGNNFWFSFLVINNSDKELFFQSINNIDTFFEVFKLGDDESPSEPISYGKPYKAVFCEYLLSGYKIQSKDSLEIKVAWVPKGVEQESYPILCNFNFDNEPLPAGNYRTSFISSFNFSYKGKSIKIEEKSFNITFKIK